MAVRNISIKFAIDGEAAFKSALANINNELKSSKSALQLAQEQFKENANSMDALTKKSKAYADVQKDLVAKVTEIKSALENAQSAVKKYADEKERLTAEIKKNADALDKAASSSGKNEKATKELTDEQERLQKALDKNEALLVAAGKGATNWETSLNKAETELVKINREIDKNDKYLEEAKNSADKTATSIDKFGKECKEAGDDAKGFGDKSKVAVDALASALAAAGIGIALERIKDALLSCVSASTEFESAFAGVAKTVTGTDQQLADLSQSIVDMSLRIPATTTEIAGVAEAAGQLGIKTEDIAKFTEVMVKLGTATNMTAQEVATSLAKMANITGMDPSNYERLGSTVVALGNNFATTENDIVSMSLRLASAGTLLGMTEQEILAFSTALSSVGIEAEAGGSAISTVLKNIAKEVVSNGDTLDDYARIAGMSADEFSKAWGDNAASAFNKFIEGLKKIDESGGSVIKTLSDLEINEIRQSNAIQSLAVSEGVLAKALSTANTAWTENNALTKEAATRFETTESKVQMAKNAFQNLKKEIGDDLTPVLRNLADSGKEVLTMAADFVRENPGLVSAIAAVVAGLAAFAGGVAAVAGWVNVVAPLLSALTPLLMGPAGLAIAAGAAAAAIGVLILTADDAVPSVSALTEKARELPEAVAQADEAFKHTKETVMVTADMAKAYVDRLKELETQSNLTETEQAEYALTLEKLKALVPDLNYSLNEQTGLLVDGADALYTQIDAWKQLAVEQAFQARNSEIMGAWGDAFNERTDNIVRQTELLREEQAILEKISELQKSDAAWYDSTEYNTLAGDLGNVRSELDNTNKAIDSANSIMEEQEGVYKSTKDAIDDYNAAQEKSGTVVDASAQKMQLLSERLGEMGDIYKKNVEELIKSTSTNAGFFSTAFTDEIKAAEAAAAARAANYQKSQEDYKKAYEAQEKVLDQIGETTIALNQEKSAYEQNAKKVESLTNKQQKLEESLIKKSEALGKAEEKMNSYSGAVDNAADSTQSIAEMIDNAVLNIDKMAEHTENLKKAAEYGITDGVLSALKEITPENVNQLGGMIDELESAGATMEGLAPAAQSMVDSLNETFDLSEEAVVKYAQTVGIYTAEAAKEIVAMAKSLNGTDLTQFVTTLEQTFGEAAIRILEDAGIEMQNTTTASMDALIAAVEARDGDAVRAIGGITEAMIAQLATDEDKLFAASEAFAMKHPEGAKTPAVTGAATEAGSALAEASIGGVRAKEPEMYSAGESSSKEVASGMASESAVSDARTAGNNIGDGLLSGLMSKWEQVKAWASRAASEMVGWFNKAFEINSPSKLIAREVGEPIVEGLVHGMDAKTPSLEKAIKKQSDLVLVGMSTKNPEFEKTFDAVAQAQASLKMDMSDITRQVQRMDALVSRYATSGIAASSATTTTHNHQKNTTVGDIVINVTAPSGTDPKAYGRALAAEIRHNMRIKGVL